MNIKLSGAAIISSLTLLSCNAMSVQAASTVKAQTVSPLITSQHFLRDEKMNTFISKLMSKMTLEEKVGQMTLFSSDWDTTGPSIKGNYKEKLKQGKVGAIFNAYTANFTRELQKIAVEETRLGIPLLFGYDVIHGHRTIFPISFCLI